MKIRGDNLFRVDKFVQENLVVLYKIKENEETSPLTIHELWSRRVTKIPIAIGAVAKPLNALKRVRRVGNWITKETCCHLDKGERPSELANL